MGEISERKNQVPFTSKHPVYIYMIGGLWAAAECKCDKKRKTESTSVKLKAFGHTSCGVIINKVTGKCKFGKWRATTQTGGCRTGKWKWRMKSQGLPITEWKMTDEIAGGENARLEKEGRKTKDWNLQNSKMTDDFYELLRVQAISETSCFLRWITKAEISRYNNLFVKICFIFIIDFRCFLLSIIFVLFHYIIWILTTYLTMHNSFSTATSGRDGA